MPKLQYFKTTGFGPNAILFLGGLGSDRDVWDQVIETLEGDYLSISLDSYGIGDNDTPSNGLSIDHLVQNCVDVVDHLCVERFLVVGHSLGGLIAQELARKYPTRVLGICLCNSFATLEDKTLMLLSRFNRLPAQRRNEIKSCIANVEKGMLDRYLNALHEYVGYSHDRRVITIPTLIINSEADELFTCFDAEVAKKNLTDYEIFTIASGHNSIEDHPSVVSTRINAFLLENNFSMDFARYA